jgi:hypothetical protein
MVSSPGVPDNVLQQNVRYQAHSGQGAGIAMSCGIMLEFSLSARDRTGSQYQ